MKESEKQIVKEVNFKLYDNVRVLFKDALYKGKIIEINEKNNTLFYKIAFTLYTGENVIYSFTRKEIIVDK